MKANNLEALYEEMRAERDLALCERDRLLESLRQLTQSIDYWGQRSITLSGDECRELLQDLGSTQIMVDALIAIANVKGGKK